MTLLRFLVPALLCATVWLPGTAAASAGDPGNPVLEAERPHAEKMDRSWKRYRNADLGYCVSYPSRWLKGDAFDGSGLFVKAGVSRSSMPVGEIDLGPLDLPSLEDARIRPASLGDDNLHQNLQEHLDGLKKFVHAESVEVLAERRMNLLGLNALYAKSLYYDPLERSKWLQEIVFIERNGQVFRLELQCPPAQIDRFEPVFLYLVNSLQFDCK